MKNYKSKLMQAIFILAVVFGAASCNNTKTEDTKEVAEDQNDEKFDDKKNEKDAQFLVNAAEINREEISLGQLAQQSGRSTLVKELGKMMEDAHTKSLAELTALAKSKNITLPDAQTEDGLDAYKKLNDKSGNDFDEAYSDMMVKGHKDAISLFENASTESADMDIRAWATATLPDLRTHLDHSLNCQKESSKK
jgi:putative membrane protein